MRFSRLLCLLLLSSGICVAQDVAQNRDTNFPVGPQYLATSGSPLFLRPIATPSLSLAPVPADTSTGAYEVTTHSAQVLTAPVAAQFPNLLTIYYKGPSASLAALSENASESGGEVSEPAVSEIEISATPLPSALPASITNIGVTEMLDPQSLRARGYGMDLAETAAFWKTHKTPAQRVFTNADVERLHGG
jgi:hypothetical protein